MLKFHLARTTPLSTFIYSFLNLPLIEQARSLQIYSTLAGLSLTFAADVVDASSCAECEQSDNFLSGLKNTCYVEIQTSSQCCKYYKSYASVCGKSCPQLT